MRAVQKGMRPEIMRTALRIKAWSATPGVACLACKDLRDFGPAAGFGKGRNAAGMRPQHTFL